MTAEEMITARYGLIDEVYSRLQGRGNKIDGFSQLTLDELRDMEVWLREEINRVRGPVIVSTLDDFIRDRADSTADKSQREKVNWKKEGF